MAIGDSLTDPAAAYTLPHQVWVRVVGRGRYRTLNLGVSGDTTADMRARVEEALNEGLPRIAVLFCGVNDAVRGVDPKDTERNVAWTVEWLRERGVEKVVLIGPGILNAGQMPDWAPAAEQVRKLLRGLAARHDALFVDLTAFMRDRIDRGDDPDFTRVAYEQSRSWYASSGDLHFNSYGHRVIAEAFLTATSAW